jgi:hypothetical protein
MSEVSSLDRGVRDPLNNSGVVLDTTGILYLWLMKLIRSAYVYIRFPASECGLYPHQAFWSGRRADGHELDNVGLNPLHDSGVVLDTAGVLCIVRMH